MGSLSSANFSFGPTLMASFRICTKNVQLNPLFIFVILFYTFRMKRRGRGGQQKQKKRCTDTFQDVTIRTLDGARALLRDGIASKLTGDPKDVLIFIRLGDKDDRFLICKKF